MADNEDWAIQLSIKHGPNLQYMTNVRGYTAADVRDHLEGLAEMGKDITEHANAYLALETLQTKFSTEPVNNDRRSGGGGSPRGGGGFASRDGEKCEPHGLPRKYKKIRSKKNGEWYELLECTHPQNPCDTIWPDRD